VLFRCHVVDTQEFPSNVFGAHYGNVRLNETKKALPFLDRTNQEKKG
jgi:hypothetical protein